MKKLTQTKWILLGSGILIAVTAVTVTITMALGKAYRQSLQNFENQTPSQEVKLTKTVSMRKITVKKAGETSCLEITPDGVVRQYQICGGSLKQANRLTNLKNIFQLFRLVKEEDLATYTTQKGEHVYEITIETDTGTQTYYLTDLQNGGGETIVDTLKKIVEDLPGASPVASASLIPSLSPQSSSISTVPNPTLLPFVTPSSDTATQTFSCGFTEGGNKKPVNVSGVICSTDPSPIP